MDIILNPTNIFEKGKLHEFKNIQNEDLEIIQEFIIKDFIKELCETKTKYYGTQVREFIVKHLKEGTHLGDLNKSKLVADLCIEYEQKDYSQDSRISAAILYYGDILSLNSKIIIKNHLKYRMIKEYCFTNNRILSTIDVTKAIEMDSDTLPKINRLLDDYLVGFSQQNCMQFEFPEYIKKDYGEMLYDILKTDVINKIEKEIRYRQTFDGEWWE